MSGVSSSLTQLHAQTRASYGTFVAQLQAHPAVQKAAAQESDNVIRTMLGLADLTDPADAKFQAAKQRALLTGRDLGMDFRRTKISLDDLVARMVDHCMNSMGADCWDSIRLVYDLLNR